MKWLNVAVLHGATGTSPDEIDTQATAAAVCDVLTAAGHTAKILWISRDLGAIQTLREQPPDVVFNLVDALSGDGAAAAKIPEELERAGLTFSGCGGRASLDCVSKPGMKQIMRANDLPTPDWSLTGQALAHLPRVIVKASHEHASIGMDAGSVVHGFRVAKEIAERARRFNTPFFAEQYVEGREFNLSLIAGPDGPEILPPSEIIFVDYPRTRPRIVDYDAKWVQDAFGYDNTPRSFDFGPEDFLLLEYLKKLALRCWRVFGLSGYARVDFRVDRRNRPWILEVNTNPCLAPDAGFAAAAACAGLNYSQLIFRIVEDALVRRKAKRLA